MAAPAVSGGEPWGWNPEAREGICFGKTIFSQMFLVKTKLLTRKNQL